MPEFRQDIVTGKWVIVATERARRPEDFTEQGREHKEPHKDTCPFCEGNETQTPPEVHSIREPGTEPDTPGWRVRTVPNKFPALTPDGLLAQGRVGIYTTMTGIGTHEVIIETTAHDRSPGQLPAAEVETIIRAYLDRYRVHASDPRLQYVLVFRNHGKRAGASLEHPHSQLIATPLIPPVAQEELHGAEDYFRRTGRCVFCHMIEEEKSAGTRVVYENQSFVAVEPFASRTPFETWILPTRHVPCFGDLLDTEIGELAQVMHFILGRLHDSLNDPAYNYMIHTAPTVGGYRHSEHMHWHLEIMPKLTIAAGFELGSGIYINTATPEATAQYLRHATP